MRAAIYARISKDSEGTELGVSRQREDCRREAQRRGWEVVEEYVDNDVSATRSKVRPEYQRMLRDIRAGHVEAVVVWAVDRLTRTPRELEDVIDLADKYGLAFANVGGTIDLSNPEGRAMARQMGTFARLEVENQAKRLRRKFQEKAEKGEPHGYAPYGYERVDGVNVLVPEQAEIVREAARRVLARESLRSIVADFNKREIHGPKAQLWNSTILRQILLRPTNAGLRQYQGRIVGPAKVDAPILSEDTFHALTALLRDASRRSNHVGPGFKYLLSGIAVCGLCGARMRRQMGRVQGGKRQPPSYQCASCFKVRRNQERVDAVVRAAMIARLSKPDAIDLFNVENAAEIRELEQRITAIDSKLAIAADQFAEDTITGEQLKRITSKLRTERESLQRRVDVSRPNPTLAAVVGVDAGGRWDALPLEARREAVELLMTVTIHPAGSGRPFDPEDVVVEWRHAV